MLLTETESRQTEKMPTGSGKIMTAGAATETTDREEMTAEEKSMIEAEITIETDVMTDTDHEVGAVITEGEDMAVTPENMDIALVMVEIAGTPVTEVAATEVSPAEDTDVATDAG